MEKLRLHRSNTGSILFLTRMHSSRMRTVRNSSRLLGGGEGGSGPRGRGWERLVPAGGVPAPGPMPRPGGGGRGGIRCGR